MRKIVMLFFLILYFAELSAQNYYLRSLDIDTGINMIRSAVINPVTKGITVISPTYLLDTLDLYNKNIIRTNFTKLDSNNNIVLNKSIELKNSSIRIRGSIKLMQGGYLAYGLYYDSKTISYGTSGVPGCLVRYTETGDTIFTKKFPYNKDVFDISSLIQTNDSSIVFASILCDSNGSFSKYNALRIVKLNSSFNTIWDSIYYFGRKVDINVPRVGGYENAIIQTSDKGYLIGASLILNSADSNYHALIFKIDSNGKIMWEKQFYGNKYEYSGINRILNLKDGNFLLVGAYTSNFNLDPKVSDFIIIIKINPFGQIIWKKLLSKYEYQYSLDVDEFTNGNILLAGQIDVRGNTHVFDSKASLICLDKNGKIIWDRQYELPSNKTYDDIIDVYLSDITIANDNSILGVGNYTVSDSSFPYNGGYDQDLLFLHADSLGCIMPGTCPITEIEQTPVVPNYFYAYPNPTSSTISFKSNLISTSNIQIKIINALGQVVCEKKLESFEEQIEVSSFNKGIYIVELKADNFIGMQKIVIE